ncbi:MAG: penicillin-resistant DD-carboxypeptidase [Myxococcaceae bacterium]|nr:penicillin-resistant DD-carboxypeptidase [Myxococcaceae bacterium]
MNALDNSFRTFNRTMAVGARGTDVSRMQDALREAGFNPGSSDGIFGRQTAAAVREFQAAKGLQTDGIVGRNTGGQLHLADTFEPAPVTGVQATGSNAARLQAATRRARELGLTVTSTTGGQHAEHSYHYRGRAVDVAGPASAMRQFYREMAATNPTELFYDPMGGIKNGRNIGAIGGHGTHVHVAY